ncbi:LrgB family protein [Ancylobacter lacus]|uniref:LrgB family protein n=1 Tax=Ancylobacter lacus TaxID=2579970 RepID=UPI001BCD7CCE|nr:LrgB family protein [Ancylobacter lacus]MBS7540566.1 LrgB family protein [Ancylobacter lacus]
MSLLSPEAAGRVLLWSLVTIGFYAAAKRIYRRWPRWWLSPLAVTPALIALVVVGLHASYRDYIGGTRWLVLLLGPATVAFAFPIYEQRALIRRHWPVLLAGMVAGSATAVLTSWALATAVGLDGVLRLSLLPRSMSTPFAMEVSGDIGGVPDLTAIFVVITGIAGGALGDLVLARLRFGSALARGALFGLGAHGVGTARAHQIGQTEGAVAGLVMVLVGLLNVLAAPLVAHLLR